MKIEEGQRSACQHQGPRLCRALAPAWLSSPLVPPAGCRPGRLTVNIGDGLTRWTDGILKSTYHRVRAPKAGDPTVRTQPATAGSPPAS